MWCCGSKKNTVKKNDCDLYKYDCRIYNTYNHTSWNACYTDLNTAFHIASALHINYYSNIQFKHATTLLHQMIVLTHMNVPYEWNIYSGKNIINPDYRKQFDTYPAKLIDAMDHISEGWTAEDATAFFNKIMNKFNIDRVGQLFVDIVNENNYQSSNSDPDRYDPRITIPYAYPIWLCVERDFTIRINAHDRSACNAALLIYRRSLRKFSDVVKQSMQMLAVGPQFHDGLDGDYI